LYLNSEYAQNQNFDEMMNSSKCKKHCHQKSEFEKDAELMMHEQK